MLVKYLYHSDICLLFSNYL